MTSKANVTTRESRTSRVNATVSAEMLFVPSPPSDGIGSEPATASVLGVEDDSPGRQQPVAPETRAGALEAPRHVIVATRLDPAAELIRWLFERARLSYHEEPHAPVLGTVAALRRGRGVSLPAVAAPEGVWSGVRVVLDGLDARSRPGERLLGESDAERTTTLALIDRLLDLLQVQVPKLLYAPLLPQRDLLLPIVVDGAPGWERSLVTRFWSLWRRLAAGAIGVEPEAVAAASADVVAACDLVEEELARRATKFLGGAQPGVIDIVAAALLSPLVVPERGGLLLPPLDALPAELRTRVAQTRDRRAGRLALDTYAAARAVPQPPMRARPQPGPLGTLTLEAWPQRLAARAAAAYGGVIQVGRYTVATRWNDVEDMLRRDLGFRIAPVNGPRIDEVNGPFVLGLDRGERMAIERPQLYDAVAAIDLDAVRALVAREAEDLLDHAETTWGRIDVVNGYARLVAARTAGLAFGLAGPTEMDLMRVCRALFWHIFLNLGGDEAVRQRALAAAEELTRWFRDEIARRHGLPVAIEDVIGRLLALRETLPDALDDDGVRRNTAGLLVGAIDTTATAVGKVMRMACSNRRLLRRISRDLDDPQRMYGWCNELLRFWTHNPILLRQADGDVSLGGKAVRDGSTVVAFTQAAMFDPARFPNPGRLDPTRPTSLYRHFGGGLHPCAGRAINAVQIPELVARLIRRGIAGAARPRFEGPFIDELVVTFGDRP